MNGLERITKERTRQIEEEGFSLDNDDSWTNGELVEAAMCYCMKPPAIDNGEEPAFPDEWPWGKEWWKPSPGNRIRELEKAGALIVAEIDRLLRMGKQG